MATSGDRYLATSGDFFMATDKIVASLSRQMATRLGKFTGRETDAFQTSQLSGISGELTTHPVRR